MDTRSQKLYGVGGSRVDQKNLIPSTIKNSQLSASIIKNSAVVEEDQVSLSNGAQLTITSTVTASVADNITVGVMPYMIALFQGSLTAANHIPFGSNVDNDVYRLYQTAVPQIGSLGHDGYNAVVMTALYNNTGSSQDIIVVTQARFLIGLGGGVS